MLPGQGFSRASRVRCRPLDAVAGGGRTGVKRLSDGLDARDLGDMGLEVPLDSDLEGHAAGWAPDAGPVKSDANQPGGGDIDEFDVAAVGLHRRADQVDHPCDAVAQVGPGFGGSGLGHDR